MKILQRQKFSLVHQRWPHKQAIMFIIYHSCGKLEWRFPREYSKLNLANLGL